MWKSIVEAGKHLSELAERYSQEEAKKRKERIDSFITPLYENLEIIHLDYMRMFQQVRDMLPANGCKSEKETQRGLSKSIEYLRSAQAELASSRAQARGALASFRESGPPEERYLALQGEQLFRLFELSETTNSSELLYLLGFWLRSTKPTVSLEIADYLRGAPDMCEVRELREEQYRESLQSGAVSEFDQARHEGDVGTGYRIVLNEFSNHQLGHWKRVSKAYFAVLSALH